ncbi:MAG: hypothetical protein AAF202_10995 [Pseudomonadota bacterium]
MIYLFFAFSLATPALGSELGAWEGLWKGSCQLNPAYLGTTEFDTSLEIEPLPGGHGHRWVAISEQSGSLPRQVRNYELLPIDVSNGHYVIDEKNGLMLDMFLTGQLMQSPFVINGNLVNATYVLLDSNKMLMQLPTFDFTSSRRTCLKGNPSLCSESFPIKARQSCELKRVLN